MSKLVSRSDLEKNCFIDVKNRICLLESNFAFSKTWPWPLVNVDQGHVFIFFIFLVSMQIRFFTWDKYKEKKSWNQKPDFCLKRWSKQSRKLIRTRPSRPIWCDVWIVERMHYQPTDRPTNQPTNRLTNQPTDTAGYRGALSHLKKRKPDARD